MEIKEKLLQKAIIAKNNAYAPYSKFYVGASILTENQNIFSSCNVENVSYPCGTCAEAGAIAAMISSGDKKIVEILITSTGKDLVYPCGACLQRISEFSSPETLIHLGNSNKICKTYKLKDLIPHQFNATELRND
jgi:cytidine deaminase